MHRDWGARNKFKGKQLRSDEMRRILVFSMLHDVRLSGARAVAAPMRPAGTL